MTCLGHQHDCLMLDLDGTVFRGLRPTEGAVEVLAQIRGRALFITNNASRSPAEVAEHMRVLGFSVDANDIITSGQSAARLLAAELSAEAAVLVVGTDALAENIRRVGLRPVRAFIDRPSAVVQGHSPRTCWSDLAEAALAIRDGARWVATNADVSFPTDRGLLPGNGAMVAALQAATGATPEMVGKPAPMMLRDGLARAEFRSPLVIGDRLDTDIAGAEAAGLSSMLVLSGVSTARDVVHARPGHRPTYIAQDLRGLNEAPAVLRIAPQHCWRVDVAADAVTVRSCGENADAPDLSVVRATAHAVWAANLHGRTLAITGGDTAATKALRRWSLVDIPTDAFLAMRRRSR